MKRLVPICAMASLVACSSRDAAPPPTTTASGSGGIPVLMYHDVITDEYLASDRHGTTYSGDVWLADFRKQMDWLADNGYTPITAVDAVAYVRGQTVKGDGRLPAKPILLTFDDSFDSHYQIWKNELLPRGFKATFFVITNYAAGQVTASGRHMTQEQLDEMAHSPLVEIESHTVNHPDLSTESGDLLTHELADSNEALTPYGVSYIAYPFGSHTAATIAEAKKWYDAAFCVGSTKALYGNDPYCIPRLGVGIWSHDDLAKFRALVE
jgi:peptidoglycan/xylan/chitin deacetylase (PgdA/CDA1 family)